MRGAADKNLILIGMPGVGKSTIGQELARRLRLAFLDTDRLIEARWGSSLQEIIDREGLDSFRSKEEERILSLEVEGHVVATGGSVVYSPRAMSHLKELGLIVWLDLPLAELEMRLMGEMAGRGVVRKPEQTLADLYRERRPLYEQYAQMHIEAEGKSDSDVVEEILIALGTTHP